MSVFRDFNYYKEEIELAIIQNSSVEIELYSIVASLIRESKNQCKLSLRDVSNRRKTKHSKAYYGKSGFPDFVVLEREKKSNPRQYGCIEIKRPTVSLDLCNSQVIGHIQSFKKVLYTNGIRWIFFEDDKCNVQFDITLGTIHRNKIAWTTRENWEHLLKEIDRINWY